ncbi:hypothetical protein ACFXHA_29110 [Nocardia sp. NPDC059240]|uniref:hypothetical protein n=1 Tax=Nocardia sp. NPDC059240 TaxID=3346786 RepID=UPI003695141F
MSLHDLSNDAVLCAIREFDSLGRADFLAKYGFGPARAYFLVLEGRRYDSKAIAGAAHGHMPGCTALQPKDFSGGDATVARSLRALGFEVERQSTPSSSSSMPGLDVGAEPTLDDISAHRKRRPPLWAWPELVLACDLTARHNWRELDVNHPEVQQLSDLLRQLRIHPNAGQFEHFRSTGSVRSKMMNLSDCHPDSRRRSSNGGALDKEVVAAFLTRPDEMFALAEQIRWRASEPYDNAVAPNDPIALDPDDSAIDLAQFRPSSEEVLFSAIKAHIRTKTNEQVRLVEGFALSTVLNGFRLLTDSRTSETVLGRGSRRWVVTPRVIQNGNVTAAVQAAAGSLTFARHFFYHEPHFDLVALFGGPIGEVYVGFLESLGIRSVWRVEDSWDGSPSARVDLLVCND